MNVKELKSNKIKVMVHDLALLPHGEIFIEFYGAGEPSGKPQQTSHIESFCTRDLLEEAKDQEGDDPMWKTIHELIKAKRYKDALIAYFKDNPSHGEWVGIVMRACYEDGNLILAKAIYDLANDIHGFDS